MSLSFYHQMPTLSRFEEITNLTNFKEVPDDWLVVISDVINSRLAIQKGLYKSVNTIGAAGIVAVINALHGADMPYVFGGDGASFCIPPNLLPPVTTALLGTQNMATAAYQLTLRVGAVPLRDIKRAGGRVLLAKRQVSEHYTQAVFAGGGLALADKMLKHPESSYLFKPKPEIEADFTGLECRWNKVTQENKTVLSLLVKVNATPDNHSMSLYRTIIDKINELIRSEHPISAANLRFSWNPNWLSNEFRVRGFFRSFLGKMSYVLNLYYRIFIGILLMRFNINIGNFSWGDYKPNLVASSDYKKFDDMLRAVISCSNNEKKELLQYLDKLEQERVIVYGLHESEAALVTCVIKEYSGIHFHFVDGDEGGYALAATHLNSKESWS